MLSEQENSKRIRSVAIERAAEIDGRGLMRLRASGASVAAQRATVASVSRRDWAGRPIDQMSPRVLPDLGG